MPSFGRGNVINNRGKLWVNKKNYIFAAPKKIGILNMDTLSYKTISANSNTVAKEWVIIDAENVVLGRLALEVAMLLRGKRKTNYTPRSEERRVGEAGR